ncbi:Tetratricopeptide-like helical domain superfamily [Arabidopsis thaliana x Arabidopsis arenosa]|uniref:Tetratricopeptide-like helical domain superfamily n=1 Tax=Arabidopsis thaliana x Arabidopsis arenosa TaxID=1240361 RepID=A0A8T2C462_9BRAS|nr:Tetratricopeptide-like helical domain superfamily [Arabidopsis thaliana x Arabidopsis arenosa]
MEANSADQKQKPKFLVEVNNIEKQLWTLIHSKGILHPDVSELYVKAGSTYEQIFKSNLQQEELQEVEFCLWKLHYKHIDEFRKGLKTNDHVKHMKAFKLFLSKAAEFYQNLISKVRDYYHRLSEECGEQKSRFLCHRFYICLGDLQRYQEQYLKTHEHPNWSTAATYYLEAAKSWPDSGNPHNQLAVLATYVGDEFLALYHCVRSLAVKEPFPGASNNLLLLFEKNRSSPLKSLSNDAQFNFSNPSERNITVKNVREDRNLIAGVDLWPLVVRTTSFFFLKSSFDEFGCAFASTIRELDAAFAADDRNLEAMLESYQFMDTARKGPYKILQLVAVFIFIFHNLAEVNGPDNVKEEVKLTNLALTMVFIVMGRVVERCLKTSPLDSSPLLPALLVFLDYLPFLLHKVEEEECRFDEKSKSAISYFFGKLVDFLNQLKVKGKNCSAKTLVALWEDHELKSLAPLAPIHVLLDFSSHMDLRESFDRGKELRLQRIINSAIEITSRQKKGSQKWLFFDKQQTDHLYTTSGELQCKEELFHGNGEGSNRKCVTIGPVEIIPCEKEISVPVEEEEVILLKPLVRCQSAPIYSSGIATKPLSSDSTTSGNQTTTSDESLRRTLSLIVNHSSQDTESESFSFTQGLKDTDPQYLHLEEGTVSRKPPSLSAWVVDKNKENGRLGLSKPNGLGPIDETGPVSTFDSLSISNSTEHPASSYSPPTPSAPLLPEDASWFHNDASTNKTESFYDHRRYTELSGFMKPYTNPPVVGISSSEWLRRYRESRNLGPAYSYQAQGTNDLRNFMAHGSSKVSLLARYGTPNEQPMISSENSTFYPQLYMEDHESRGEKLCNGEQCTTNAYGFSDDPGPFLRFLREKDWLNENGQRLRGPSPAYMNN